MVAEWLIGHWIELAGALLGVLYVFLAARQNIWCWPVGILNVGLYIVVFFYSGLYGDMALQTFYLFMGIYGWYRWSRGGTSQGKEGMKISRISPQLLFFLIVVSALGSFVFGYILTLTPSSIPYWDGTTTALGLVCTWMTARKILENWIGWVIADLLSAGIYVYKELYLTVGLYLVLTTMAVFAYRQWLRDYKKKEEN